MDKAFYTFMGFMCLILLFCVFGCAMALKQQQEGADKCVAEGNHPIHLRRNDLCLSPDGRILYEF